MVFAALLAMSGTNLVPQAVCRILLAPKAVHDEVTLPDTTATPCVAEQPHRTGEPLLSFDPVRRTVTARVALMQGQYLGHVYFPVKPKVAEGAHVALQAHVGSVSIQRNVVAMQNGYSGRHMFVRDGDGVIFAVAVDQIGARP